jgi:hypothetical protein
MLELVLALVFVGTAAVLAYLVGYDDGRTAERRQADLARRLARTQGTRYGPGHRDAPPPHGPTDPPAGP